jgi:hypothetical protein
MANSKKINGPYPYCGKQAILTLDHVIPKCLFTNGIPGNSPKIYVCSPCNNILKSRLDTDLRDMLIFDMDSSQSPHTQLLHPRLARSIGSNQSKIVRAMKEHSYPVQISNEPDATIHGYTSHLANIQMPSILTMIVSGLYFHHTERILPPDIGFSGTHERNHNRCEKVTQMYTEAGNSLNQIGNGEVFEYRFAIKDDNPDDSAWMLIFYKRAFFIMLTQSPEKMIVEKSVD